MYTELYGNSTDEKTKNLKRSIEVQPSLIPRSKRVTQPVPSPKSQAVLKKAPSSNSNNTNALNATKAKNFVKPALTLKDASGNELAMDSELSLDIQAALAELEDPYNPAVPNEYAEYTLKREQAQMLEREQARLSELVFQQKRLQEHAKMQQQQREKESEGMHVETPAPMRDAPPPPEEPVLSFAEKMMLKMGWKGDGYGLGKKQQGMASALIAQKTGVGEHGVIINTAAMELERRSINPTGSLPSRVIVLHNLAGPGEVDAAMGKEISEECEKYGVVLNCQVHESLKEVNPEEVVKVYVKFKYQDQALKALMDLDGRYFGGREVRADYYNELAFDNSEFRNL